MPYVWEPSPLCLEHKGVEIYYIFKDDDGSDNGVRRTYQFGLTPNSSDRGEDNGEFDIRDTQAWRLWRDRTPHHFPDEEGIKYILRSAIETGELMSFEVWEETGFPFEADTFPENEE